ncbi:DUF6705 family protein [Chryseobacterium aquaticum]|uniref:DUF6705 family protein n=1 Tax=Chryseobacterium aquaticum TaxID=452084 RepID=UPI002FC92BAA
MKNIIIKSFMLSIIISVMNCKSQTIIVRGGNNGILPENFNNTGQYYYKDVNNYFDNFTGTWEYVNGNEKFQIILTKIVKYHFINNDIKLNIYEDGITLKYKKFINNNLVFESPTTGKPTFSTTDGIILDGYMKDYERITRTIYYPKAVGGGIMTQGGEYFTPNCIIELQPQTLHNEPKKIKFSLSFGWENGGFGSPNDNPMYNGMPTFSIPNDVVMTKVP